MSGEYVEADREELALHVPSVPVRDDDLKEGYCSYCLQVWPCEESTRLILVDLIAELRPYERYSLTDYRIIERALNLAEQRLRDVTGT